MTVKSPEHRWPETIATIDQWPVNVAHMDQAVNCAVDAAKKGIGFCLFTLNLDHLVKLRYNSSFRKAYHSAELITADGAPLAALGRRQNRMLERTAGADIVYPLAEAAAERGLPIYLFGASSDVLARAGRSLSQTTSKPLSVAGTASPRQGFDVGGAEADAAIDAIAASGARLCFVALGAPKQELFAARAREKGVKVGFVAIGAALDFIAGQQSRAPRFMQDHGLEWLWRWSTNPVRLTRRYLSCIWLLGDLVVSRQIQQVQMSLSQYFQNERS